MELNQMKPRASAKDFFLNLGAIVALYTVAVSLINLLFTIINRAYPQITSYYYGTPSISWPVSVILIFFPVYILLMLLLEKGYAVEPERKQLGVRKWLTYVTLFIAGLTMAIDLVTVLYYFIDGQELTAGFLLKVLSVLVVTLLVFVYYISDLRGKLTSSSKKVWIGVATVLILASIVWGFAVLGSPAKQRQVKYDEQRVSDLQNVNQFVLSYYQTHAGLPGSLSDITSENTYSVLPVDPQTKKPYEYVLVGQSAKAYELCAEFNLASNSQNRTEPVIYLGDISWAHPAGHYCYTETIPVSQYPGGKLPM